MTELGSTPLIMLVYYAEEDVDTVTKVQARQ
jgi:hypothetical protein